jgi:flagellar biosynthesis protein FlhF
MIVKKFQAPTEMEAILKAKEELGNTAVVLSVKSLKQRGIFKLFKKDLVEITAALEENDFVNGIKDRKPSFTKPAAEAANSSLAQPKTSYAQVASTSNKNTASKINLVADENVSVKPETAAIEQKLDSLHNLLKNQMGKDYENTSKKLGKQDSNAETSDSSKEMPKDGQKIIKERETANFKFLQLIYKKMIDNEVAEKYADAIVGDIENSLQKEANIDSILSAVYQKIILKLGEPKTITLEDKPKVIFFIGPTGVGKTTTIAKIASKFKLERHAKVAFITSDTYRIAAVEQLNTYASIIDCPVSVVYSADEMDECLEEYKNYDLIMVDTAGRSHKSEEQMTELSSLIHMVENNTNDFDFEVYLTLSITTKYKDLINITEKYSDIDNWSIIFTKLDETCSLGNILNIRLLTDAQLSYTTSGQNVPNDIEVINEQALAKQLLGGNL